MGRYDGTANLQKSQGKTSLTGVLELPRLSIGSPAPPCTFLITNCKMAYARTVCSLPKKWSASNNSRGNEKPGSCQLILVTNWRRNSSSRPFSTTNPLSSLLRSQNQKLFHRRLSTPQTGDAPRACLNDNAPADKHEVPQTMSLDPVARESPQEARHLVTSQYILVAYLRGNLDSIAGPGVPF